MNETLSPADAARVLTDASRYEHDLRQRTEGLTVMVWGLATPAIFLTYYLANVLEAPAWALATLWIPWVAIANLLTIALYRSAVLTSRSDESAFDKGDLGAILFASAAIATVMLVLRPTEWVTPLFVLAGLWAGFALLNPFGISRRGRIMSLVTAGGFALGATITLLAFPTSPAGPIAATAFSGLAPLAVGLYQTLTA